MVETDISPFFIIKRQGNGHSLQGPYGKDNRVGDVL